MYVVECASQPHLWGTHSPSLASLLPLADILLIDDWNKYFGSSPQEPGGRYGEFCARTNGRRRNACEPGGAAVK